MWEWGAKPVIRWEKKKKKIIPDTHLGRSPETGRPPAQRHHFGRTRPQHGHDDDRDGQDDAQEQRERGRGQSGARVPGLVAQFLFQAGGRERDELAVGTVVVVGGLGGRRVGGRGRGAVVLLDGRRVGGRRRHRLLLEAGLAFFVHGRQATVRFVLQVVHVGLLLLGHGEVRARRRRRRRATAAVDPLYYGRRPSRIGARATESGTRGGRKRVRRVEKKIGGGFSNGASRQKFRK